LKIGIPKIRLSRKVLLISVAFLAVLAGSGAAAIYSGAADSLLNDQPKENPAGEACNTVQNMILKTPAKRLWLRKYIRMEHADGATRIKTALRVAGLLAKANSVDLVQVNVLDTKGPTTRADMRGRAIGAEVVIALRPEFLPDMKEPFIVRYYEGMASDEGRYYGERISLDLPEIQKLMSAMRDVPDKQDCAELPKPEDKSAGHEGKPSSEHVISAEPAGHEQPSGHDAKPASEENAAGEHGAKTEEGAEAKPHGTEPKKEASFLDSVLSMVGLGGSEAKPAEAHDAKAEDTGHAVTDEPLEPAAEMDLVAKPDAHATEPAEHRAEPVEKGKTATDAHADTTGHEPEKAEDVAADKHVEAEPAAHDVKPVLDHESQPEKTATH
jgi:hypothetical protein